MSNLKSISEALQATYLDLLIAVEVIKTERLIQSLVK